MPTTARSRPPSREEFQRIVERLDELTRQMDTTAKELNVQFKRMAQLQADIDVIRSAWATVKTKGDE